MSQTRSSYEPTRLPAGQAATTPPTGPRDQPCAMFAVRVAAIPSASNQRAREGADTRCRAADSITIELAQARPSIVAGSSRLPDAARLGEELRRPHANRGTTVRRRGVCRGLGSVPLEDARHPWQAADE